MMTEFDKKLCENEIEKEGIQMELLGLAVVGVIIFFIVKAVKNGKKTPAPSPSSNPALRQSNEMYEKRISAQSCSYENGDNFRNIQTQLLPNEVVRLVFSADDNAYLRNSGPRNTPKNIICVITDKRMLWKSSRKNGAVSLREDLNDIAYRTYVNDLNVEMMVIGIHTTEVDLDVHGSRAGMGKVYKAIKQLDI